MSPPYPLPMGPDTNPVSWAEECCCRFQLLSGELGGVPLSYHGLGVDTLPCLHLALHRLSPTPVLLRDPELELISELVRLETGEFIGAIYRVKLFGGIHSYTSACAYYFTATELYNLLDARARLLIRNKGHSSSF